MAPVTDSDLAAALAELRRDEPGIGASRARTTLVERHGWAVSERRVRRALRAPAPPLPAPAASGGGAAAGRQPTASGAGTAATLKVYPDDVVWRGGESWFGGNKHPHFGYAVKVAGYVGDEVDDEDDDDEDMSDGYAGPRAPVPPGHALVQWLDEYVAPTTATVLLLLPPPHPPHLCL